MHRGYHGLAMPIWERKIRVFGWWNNFFLGRDIVSLTAVQQPRAAFEEFAARPKPPAAAGAGTRRDIRQARAEGRQGEGRARRGEDGRGEGRRRAGRREVVWDAAPPAGGVALP